MNLHLSGAPRTLAIFALLSLAAASRVACEPSPETVLIAQTGWTSSIDNISLADLRREYCAGRIAATARARAQKWADCAVNTAPTTAAAFYPASKDRILLLDSSETTPRMKTLRIDGHSPFAQPEQYPLGRPRRYTHFIFTGVTALSRYTGKSADANGVGVLTEKVRPFFQTADFIHVSNEVSFTPSCEFIPGTRFCSKQPHFQAFRDLRVNVVELTGNHNRDYGNEPFLRTLEWFHSNGMKTFGGGRDEQNANEPLVLTANGTTLVLIGFNELCPLHECAEGRTPGANRFDPAKAKAAIQAARQKYPNAFIMSTVQYGEVSSYKPTESQRRISYALLDDGADLSFGSQAHQVQQMEFRKGKVILHGIGNFLFDQTHTYGLRQGYFMNLYFDGNRLAGMEPVFTWIDEKFRPVPASDAQTKEIKAAIYSDELLYKD